MFNLKKLLIASLMLSGILTFAKTTKSSDYKLEEVVVLSRHGIRAPLSGKNSILDQVTTHKWNEWTANTSELTLKGGYLETMMGQYFRKWLEAEGLFKDGECPTNDTVNIYSNSMQRTIATANYFKAGFMPVCNFNVVHRYSPSKMDPVFFPRLTKVNENFKEQAVKEILATEKAKNMKEYTEKLAPSFKEIEDLLDMKDSYACKKDNLCKLDDYDTKLYFELGKEPNLSGSLKLATRIADALVLQYFEVPDDKEAGFGKILTEKQWESISHVKDVYGDVLFSAPIVAINVAHPLLVYMQDELNAPNRKLTYLVGHDSNLASITSALEVEEYSLPNTIEKKTPIGSKLVIQKFVNSNNEKYIKLYMYYQSTEQLRQSKPLDIKHPPMMYEISLKGLKKNKDGYYKFEDVNNRFTKAIRAYEEIK